MNIDRKHTPRALCAVMLLGAALAQAQTSSQQPAQKPARQPPAKTAAIAPSAPIAGVIPLGVTTIEADLIAPGYRASKLLKQDVYNDAGQKVGTIEDMVIAPDGTLSAAVVEVGGFLGGSKHRVAIPVKQFTELHPKVVLPGANKDALRKLPVFIPA